MPPERQVPKVAGCSLGASNSEREVAMALDTRRTSLKRGVFFLFLFLFLAVAQLSLAVPERHPKCFPAGSRGEEEMDSEVLGSKRKSTFSEETSEVSSLKEALRLLDADFFNDWKVEEMAKGAKEFNIGIARANRKLVASVDGGLHDPSVLLFNPLWGGEEKHHGIKRFSYPSVSNLQKPDREEDIAFMSVLELGHLIKTKKITSLELTEIFMRRLKKHGPVLEAVVSYTEDLAYKQAKEADDLLERGVYLGPLHGIPYGLKDIISVPHYKTTWGSTTFKDQILDVEAWVYKRLKSAGAVLIAKLVSGSLAYDDIWFGGRTRNPWNIEEFSTGSSAGSAAGTSAGTQMEEGGRE